jgi:hypothetical protein
MLIIILAILFLIYLLTLMKGSIGRLNPQYTQFLRISLFISAPILIIVLIISRYNIYPRGYWFPRVLFWVVVFQLLILFGFGHRSKLSWIETKIYGFFFFAPLCFIPLLLIPFLGIAMALVFYVSFIGDKSFIIYSDRNIRIENEGIRLLGPDPALGVYVKEGVFCFKDTILTDGYDVQNDRLNVRKLNDSTYLITHYSPDNWQIPNGSEEFKYTLPSK